MAGLPQLIEEDVQGFNESLNTLLQKTEAKLALLTDKGGFRVAQQGDAAGIDTMALASLATGSFIASQEIARLVGEPSFNFAYQQGVEWSTLVLDVDESSALIVLFSAKLSAGVIKYYAEAAAPQLAQVLQKARDRAPGETIDPIMLNISDSEDLFRKKK